MTTAKISSFSLYFTLFLSLSAVIFPISDAELRPLSLKAENGGVQAQELWCVAKNNAEDAALQSAINWACSTGGADCAPIQQGGPCYDPSNLQNTASYAFNDYFLKHGLSDDSCNFDNTAAITSLNPSHDNCKFPSSLKAATPSNGSFSGSTSSPLGLGSSEDMSGCNDVAGNWPRALIISHLVLMFSWTVLG
ncbi:PLASMODESMATA CALLOSE-BINDING PROTEIN 5-like [Neltuma alba]|uniref:PLASMODESMATA CALLOSE-BINDING PROTEIN 5-like n=1 Tax=Neltuma alba TaxID=207710 RepID=UPI0010A2D575|nr:PLASMODESMATA CALLOSE-BINDING PROTEIN 5-like [Prosopis alba]